MLDFDDLIEPDLFHWEQLQQLLQQQQINDPAFIESLQRLALGRYSTAADRHGG